MAGANGVDMVPPEHGHSVFHGGGANGPAVLRIPLVAVDALNQKPLAVQEHQAVLQFKTAESGFVGDNLCRFAVRSPESQCHQIKFRRFMLPGENVGKLQGLAVKEIPFLA